MAVGRLGYVAVTVIVVHVIDGQSLAGRVQWVVDVVVVAPGVVAQQGLHEVVGTCAKPLALVCYRAVVAQGWRAIPLSQDRAAASGLAAPNGHYRWQARPRRTRVATSVAVPI